MKTGKCYSKINKGQRKKSDLYETPYSMTDQFLMNEKFNFNATVLEPACGNMAIVKVLKEYYCKNNITYYDIEQDFLKENKNFSYIITNPPFSLANEFILKAFEVCTKKFAFLMPLVYLHGKWRYDNIYSKVNYFNLKHIHVFTRMPMLGKPLNEDGTYTTGMQVYAWFVWEKNNKDFPIIKWIDNNYYVR